MSRKLRVNPVAPLREKPKIASNEPLPISRFVRFFHHCVHHYVFYKLTQKKKPNRESEPAEPLHRKIPLPVSFCFSTFFGQPCFLTRMGTKLAETDQN